MVGMGDSRISVKRHDQLHARPCNTSNASRSLQGLGESMLRTRARFLRDATLPDDRNDYGVTALQIAAAHGTIDAVQLWLCYNANLLVANWMRSKKSIEHQTPNGRFRFDWMLLSRNLDGSHCIKVSFISISTASDVFDSLYASVSFIWHSLCSLLVAIQPVASLSFLRHALTRFNKMFLRNVSRKHLTMPSRDP